MMRELLKQRNAEIKMVSESEFEELLDALTDGDEWISHPISQMQLGYIQRGTTPAYVYSGADASQVREAYENGSFYLVSQGAKYLVNEVALFTLKDRAGLNCSHTAYLLNSGFYDEFCTIYNMAFPHYQGKSSMMMLRSGQLICAHSSNYVMLSQQVVFETFIRKIMGEFPNAKFEQATYTHDQTFCQYALDDHKSDLMEAYIKAWKKAGFPASELSKMRPAMICSTSDTGKYCVEMEPILKQGPFTYPLGNKVKVKHNGSASTREVEKGITKCIAKLLDGLMSMSDLLAIEIQYPVASLVRAATEIGLAKSAKIALRNLVETYKCCISPGETVTAFELFTQICEIRYSGEFISMTKTTRDKVQDSLYQLLTYDWAANDEPGSEEVL